MLVKNVMTKNPITITPECSVTEAKALMNKKNIGKLPVVDKNFKLVGMLTKGDIEKAAPSDATTLDQYEIGYLLSKLTVEKVMVKKVITVPDTEVVENAAKIMQDNSISCVPVISGDLVVGIITQTDLFRLFTEMFGANDSGVRVILTLDDKPGSVSRLVDGLAAENGNLVSLVTRELPEAGKRRLTFKVSGISEEKVRNLLQELSLPAVDIRVN